MAPLDDDEYDVPLLDQRYFGAGLRKRRVKFVSSSSNLETTQSLPTAPSPSVAERYREIVLKKRRTDDVTSIKSSEDASDRPPDLESSDHVNGPEGTSEKQTTCEICLLPITATASKTTHESSIAHQVCLQHSHPPSHLDRQRKGLAVLASQGWDPDSRKGLGAGGEGILYPIRAKENPKRAGLGVKPGVVKKVEKPVRLDAGKVRLMEKEGKKKAERLREAFYRSEDVIRLLGE